MQRPPLPFQAAAALPPPPPPAPWPLGTTSVPPSTSPFASELDPVMASIIHEQRRPLLQLFDMFRTSTKTTSRLVVPVPVIVEQRFIAWGRFCGLCPNLLSQSELFEVFKIAYATDQTSPSGLTFSGFCFATCKAADAIFSGPQWRDVYSTSFSRIRLFLFWVQQGTKQAITFAGNVERLTEGNQDIIPIEADYAKANSCLQEFQRAGIRFALVGFDLGGVATETPLILPHVAHVDDALRRLFNWYAKKEWSAAADNGGYLLNSSQFARFVRDCGLRDESGSLSSGIVDIVYKVVTSSHDTTANDVWKENSFTKTRHHKSMKHRKMSYSMFYVALADLAVRKYSTKKIQTRATKSLAFALGSNPNSKMSGENIRAYLHQLILHDLLPVLTKFFHKVGVDYEDGTAVVAGSPARKRAIEKFGNGIGRTPEKRAAGWELKHAVINHLESVLKSSAVLRAFHLHHDSKSNDLNNAFESAADTKEEEEEEEEKKSASQQQETQVVAGSSPPASSTKLLEALVYGTHLRLKSPAAATTTMTIVKTAKMAKRNNVTRRRKSVRTTTGYRPKRRQQEKQKQQQQQQQQQQQHDDDDNHDDNHDHQAETITSASRRMSLSLSSTLVAGTQLLQDGAADDGANGEEEERKRKRERVKELETKENFSRSVVDEIGESGMSSSSPRAKQFLQELSDLHHLLEHVKQTAETAVATTPSSSRTDGSPTMTTTLFSSQQQQHASPANVQIHRSGSIDVSVYSRSGIVSDFNLAVSDNDEKDRELSDLLGTVRSKLNQLRTTIGAEPLAESLAEPLSRSTTFGEERRLLPEPNTPGVSLDMRDLMEEEAAAAAAAASTALDVQEGEDNDEDDEQEMIGVGAQKESRAIRIGTPPSTKSSKLRAALTHGNMKKPSSSFIFPKSATKRGRNRRNSFMASNKLEQQWSAGRRERQREANEAQKMNKKKKKKSGGEIIPPPHVQRQIQRRALGLPNRHQLQTKHSGWTPPVCGYSSFNVKGPKYPPNGGVSDKLTLKKQSPKLKMLTRRNISPRRQQRKPAPSSLASASPRPALGNSSMVTTTTENGEFEIIFSRELQVRVVLLHQVVDKDDANEMVKKRVEIREQKDSIVHCRVLLSRNLSDGGLKTVRVILTKPEEVRCYRHVVSSSFSVFFFFFYFDVVDILLAFFSFISFFFFCSTGCIFPLSSFCGSNVIQFN